MKVRESDLIRSICRESFYEFVKEFWDVVIDAEPVLNWHIKFICDELQTVAERVFLGQKKAYDLVVNVPPGSTKSTICSQMFPAWCWTRMGAAKFICGSYAHQIALKDSIRTRDIVQSEKYQAAFPEIVLREDENTKGLFVNTLKGFRYSVGTGGAVTGYHGHFLIVDDPINPEESFSEAELKKVNRWMETTLPSRKVDKEVSVTILIQQRLHQGDPSGEMLEKYKRNKHKKIRHINLPGILTKEVSPPEARAFYKDGLLDPIRLSRPILDEMREDLGEYGFSSQVLQRPVPLGGGMFKVDKLHIVEEAPRHMEKMVRYWDKAGTLDGGAFTVGLLMGKDRHGCYWVLDVKRAQLDSARREALIKSTALVDGYSIEIGLEQEGGSGGKESAENTIRNLAGFKVKADHPTGSKEERADPFSTQVNAGNVYVLNRPWTKEYIEELEYFPNSRYKDQVDASSGAFSRLVARKKKAGSWRSEER